MLKDLISSPQAQFLIDNFFDDDERTFHELALFSSVCAGLGVYADSSDADSEVEDAVAKTDDHSDWEPDYVIRVSLNFLQNYFELI